jgi:hypothetical protein
MEIHKTITVIEGICRFWSSPSGWAPETALNLLEEARLDRFLSFAHTLPDFVEPFLPEVAEARLIVGYASLRSMSESLLKLFFSVYYEDYRCDPEIGRIRNGNVTDPNDSKFDQLIHLFSLKGTPSFALLLRRIQSRGNGIHAFKDRDTGAQSELIKDIEEFGDLLIDINARLPYPDDLHDPALALASREYANMMHAQWSRR